MVNTDWPPMSLQELAWCLHRGMQPYDLHLLDTIIDSPDRTAHEVFVEEKRAGAGGWEKIRAAGGRLIFTIRDGDGLLHSINKDIASAEYHRLHPSGLGLLVHERIGPPEIQWDADVRRYWHVNDEVIKILSWIGARPGTSVSKVASSSGFHALVDFQGNKKPDLSNIHLGMSLIYSVLKPTKLHPQLATDVHGMLGVENRSRLVLTSAGEHVLTSLNIDPTVADGQIPPPPSWKPKADNWEW